MPAPTCYDAPEPPPPTCYRAAPPEDGPKSGMPSIEIRALRVRAEWAYREIERIIGD